jgi:hypothetical protein
MSTRYPRRGRGGAVFLTPDEAIEVTAQRRLLRGIVIEIDTFTRAIFGPWEHSSFTLTTPNARKLLRRLREALDTADALRTSPRLRDGRGSR